jgi:hypothetical protein
MKSFVSGTVLSIIFCQAVNATVLSYTATNLGGNAFEYVYTIENNTLQVPVNEFTIWFDEQKYENLQIMTAAPLSNEWDEIILASTGFGIPLGYDALNPGSGIPADGSVSGFKIRFDWLGVGVPGGQAFEIINPADSTTIESGFTVPEPITVLLFGIGLLLGNKTRNI